MLPVAFDPLEDTAHFLRRIAVNLIENELGVTKDGVERSAQLVAHIREELRLVFARNFQLAALFLEFTEQPSVLNGKNRLRPEGLQQIDRAFRKLAGLLAPHHQRADDPIGAKQRDGQMCAETSAQD